MSNKSFWLRLIMYITIGLVAPTVFLIWRFKLFEKIDSVSIGGWGVVCILFVGIFFIKLMQSIRKGLPFSFFTQCLEGAIKVIIPLLLSILIIYFLKNSINELIQFLIVLTVTQLFAIPINPLPQWSHDNNLKDSELKLKNIAQTLGIIKKD